MKFIIPFDESLIPKYPEIRTKQLTPIIEKHSMVVFVIAERLLPSIKDIMLGRGNVAPVKCTQRIISILMMRSISILDCLALVILRDFSNYLS